MKVLAATLLAMVFVASGSAMAGNSKKAKASAATTKCSTADKKAGKCGNVSTATAAAGSVRRGSMENPSARVPASVMESNTH